MSNIRVRIRNPETIRARLRPQQGIRVGNSNKYLFDPDLVTEYVEDARDWAIKTDGLVDEEDYSSKAWAIGGTGTETNNAKYWAEQASRTLPNDGQLDIQVNGSSIATFTANQSGNTTADITIPDSLPDQTGNAGKFLSTDGTEASWEYPIKYRGSYDSSIQYYPGDVVRYYFDGQYLNFLCKQASVGNAPGDSDYWCGFENNKFLLQKLYGDYPIMPFMKQSTVGTTINTVSFIPGSTSTYNNFPTINTSTGLLKAPSGIDGYSPDSAFGATAFSNNYSDLDNLPNYGAGLSYSSSSLQLLDQNGNNLGSAVTIKSTPDLDGTTISTNSDDELQAVGVIEKNTGAVKYDWIGTLAEYNSQNVETLHPDWICYITDDVSGGTSVYTKTEVDNAISTALTAMLDSAFPVGYRYITEASTCPLATLIPNSTWVLTSQGRVIQGADSNHASGTTAEAGLPNITGSFVQYRSTNYATMGSVSGAFTDTGLNGTSIMSTSNTTGTGDLSVKFDASKSNSIYGNSTTVQPPAEFVNIFKRVA